MTGIPWSYVIRRIPDITDVSPTDFNTMWAADVPEREAVVNLKKKQNNRKADVKILIRDKCSQAYLPVIQYQIHIQ